MKDKMKGLNAIGRAIASLMLAGFFLLVYGATAEIVVSGTSIQDAINSAGPCETILVYKDINAYAEDLLVNRCVTLRGIDNPVLTNGSPGGNVITIDVPDSDEPEVIIEGFTITGSSSAGILVNDCPDVEKPLLIYNNIISNSIGYQKNDPEDCELQANAILNFWGKNGTDEHRGEPGAGYSNHYNNAVSPDDEKLYYPWLTDYVTDGKVTNVNEQYPDCNDPDLRLVLDNLDYAGIYLELFDGHLKYSDPLGFTSLGSALYNSSPYINTEDYPLPGKGIKYYNAFIKHYEGPTGKVLVGISYLDDEVEDVFEDTLKPYLFTGDKWIAANNVEVDDGNNYVQGTFPTFNYDWDKGLVIALIGQTYKVTIVPHEDPSTPIQEKPVFTTFKIESMDNIEEVSYQIDGCYKDSCKDSWEPIEGGTGLATPIWENSDWNITDEDWDNLTDGSHTFYFKFTDGSEIGNSGEISWQFVKGGEVPPEDLVKVISPKPGQKLSRTPVQIKWTLPSEENIDSIDIWFDRYGDFNMNGGLNNPLHLATLGGGTTFSWRSPNIQTDTAKILVVVTYMDGSEYYGISENFSIVKGYSFKAYKKAPKPVYNIGSGISQGVATIGAWFHKPRLPFLV